MKFNVKMSTNLIHLYYSRVNLIHLNLNMFSKGGELLLGWTFNGVLIEACH